MKFIYFIFIVLSFNIYSNSWVSLDSEMIYVKTLKSNDYINLHNGITASFDLGSDFYILAKVASNFEFNKISKTQLELEWAYEFYFFDIHPFIAYGGGYYMLNDDKINHLIYFRLAGGVLFHFYEIWKRLKIGSELSSYLFLGTNKYIALSISGVFFIRIEF